MTIYKYSPPRNPMHKIAPACGACAMADMEVDVEGVDNGMVDAHENVVLWNTDASRALDMEDARLILAIQARYALAGEEEALPPAMKYDRGVALLQDDTYDPIAAEPWLYSALNVDSPAHVRVEYGALLWSTDLFPHAAYDLPASDGPCRRIYALGLMHNSIAARKMYIPAISNLIFATMNGIGIPPNVGQAMYYFRRLKILVQDHDPHDPALADYKDRLFKHERAMLDFMMTPTAKKMLQKPNCGNCQSIIGGTPLIATSCCNDFMCDANCLSTHETNCNTRSSMEDNIMNAVQSSKRRLLT
jgi:hypothetical protein